MAESIVKAPLNADSKDYDFLAFSFNGKHSYDDFGIYRVSDGDRYNVELTPQMNDKTVDNVGGDGMFFFGTTHKQRVFNINFAFDHMDDGTLRAMRQWLNGKEIHDLWFDEEPYKVYSAKVTSTATIKHVAFEEKGGRIYKGEGSIQFTAYWPYAHTPDYVRTNYVYIPEYFQYVEFVTPIPNDYTISIKGYFPGGLNFLTRDSSGQQSRINISNSNANYTEVTVNTNDKKFLAIGPTQNSYVQAKIEAKRKNASDRTYYPVYCDLPGKYDGSYSTFKTFDWNAYGVLSPDEDSSQKGENYGDIPAPFILTDTNGVAANTSKTYKITEDLQITVGGTGQAAMSNIIWDSKTGIVSARIGTSEKNATISYTGNSLGGIPVGGCTPVLNGATLQYHYWYY